MDINFSGPINFMGYGIVSFNLYKALVEAGNQVALWPLPTPQYVESHPDNHSMIRDGVSRQETYNPQAPSIRHWHQFDLAQHVGKGTKIGSTVFELDKFSDREIHHLKSQDAICVPTKWAKQIIENNEINLPTCVLPHGVDRSIFNENVQPALPELREGNQTIFLNIGKWEIRKGHDVLVDAFNKAFEPSDNVRLVMSCYNPFYSAEENKEWENLYKNSKMGDRIYILESRLALQQDVASLMACADCGVFPARSEGWGLESLEMMSMGKHVILTNYAGHTEYANRDNSLLITPGPLEDSYDGKWFHGQGQWASMGDCQIEELVIYMRGVHNEKQNGILNINNDGIDTSRKLSWNNSANILTNFLESLT